MVDKLHEYQGPAGQFHTIRDNVKSSFSAWRENFTGLDRKMVDKFLRRNAEETGDAFPQDIDFSYVHRRKTRWELLRLCAVVMGIEFSYSAITAFSSPILLEMGVNKQFMSMAFSLSPMIGFFLSPLCGSLSDQCSSSFGRRRVFIVAFSTLELLGLFLIPYSYGAYENFSSGNLAPAAETVTQPKPNLTTNLAPIQMEIKMLNFSVPKINEVFANRKATPAWIIVLAVIGIVFADHFADNLQNPSRAYLLDVCNEADHTRGLSTFTILAGCGGTIGYGLGSVDWNESFIGQLLGGQIKTVFWLTSVLFIVCVFLTITSFKEVPLKLLPKVEQQKFQYYCRKPATDGDDDNDDDDDDDYDEDVGNGQYNAIKLKNIAELDENVVTYVDESNLKNGLSNSADKRKSLNSLRNMRSQSLKEAAPPLREYLQSIVKLPYSLKILLITNVLCWMSHVSYSLYFTDYVGEAIFMGDPAAMENTESRTNYEEGIRFACRGMAIYSFSCMLCSIFMEKVIQKYGLRRVYLVNISIDIVSMFLMYFFNSREASIIFSFASGILYCTIFTIPYIIVARYHTLNVFEVDSNGDYIYSTQVRGIGTDVSIIGSSVFIAQFFLSLSMGFIINWYGSTQAVPLMCTLLSTCALTGAFNIVYLDM